jgi:hypothetical protein
MKYKSRNNLPQQYWVDIKEAGYIEVVEKGQPACNPSQFFKVKRIRSKYYSWQIQELFQRNIGIEPEVIAQCRNLQEAWSKLNLPIDSKLNEKWIKQIFKRSKGNIEQVIEIIQYFYPNFDKNNYTVMLLKWGFIWNSKE